MTHDSFVAGFSDGTLVGAVNSAWSGGECSSSVKMVIEVQGGCGFDMSPCDVGVAMAAMNNALISMTKCKQVFCIVMYCGEIVAMVMHCGGI